MRDAALYPGRAVRPQDKHISSRVNRTRSRARMRLKVLATCASSPKVSRTQLCGDRRTDGSRSEPASAAQRPPRPAHGGGRRASKVTSPFGCSPRPCGRRSSSGCCTGAPPWVFPVVTGIVCGLGRIRAVRDARARQAALRGLGRARQLAVYALIGARAGAAPAAARHGRAHLRRDADRRWPSPSRSSRPRCAWAGRSPGRCTWAGCSARSARCSSTTTAARG